MPAAPLASKCRQAGLLVTTEPLPTRRVTLEYPADMNPIWSQRFPEFACAANGISLIMPYAEPYFVKSIRTAFPYLDDDQRTQAEAFVRQESQHHRQHRRFNDLIVAQYPGVTRVEGWMQRTYGWLSRTRSLKYNLAFAAGSETIAFTVARWSDDHLDQLFAAADRVPATLFLWHLAEEVEHKSAAFDVFEAVDGSRLRYATAMTMSFVILAWFTFISTLAMLYRDKRVFLPITYFRLLRWGLSYAWDALPTMLASALPGHHPSSLTDPAWLSAWLRYFDPATGTLPEPAVLTETRPMTPDP